MENKENLARDYLDSNDYRRIANDIVRLLSRNHATYCDAKYIIEDVFFAMNEQKVQEPGE